MAKDIKIKAGIVAGILLIVVIAIALSMGKKPQEKKAMAKGAAMTVVKAEKPVTGSISLTSGLTGTVEASDSVNVYAKTQGDVTAVMVMAGDTVTPGQTLCEIDTEQVASAKIAMDSAQLSLSEAQSDLSRMQILYNGGDLSDQEYQQYTNKVQSAKLQYESKKLLYDQQIEYSTVTAPIGGKIESVDIEVHDRVSQSALLCVIAGQGEKRVSFYVTERMMQNIKVGDKLEIQKNGKAYEAYISEISSMVDPDVGFFKVKAELQDGVAIATGSTIKLNLVTEHSENVMTVPVDAIYYAEGKAYVYVYKEGIVNRVGVEVGLYDSDKAEILTGLTKDDMVISTWSSNLYEGAKVQILSEENQKTDHVEENQKTDRTEKSRDKAE